MKTLFAVFAFSLVAFGQQLPPVDVPGVVNPLVTQANLKKTVCVANWTSTVRPSTSYTNKLKIQKMADLHITGKPSDYELDHRLDLAGGGAPSDPANLWVEIWPEARLKDRLESYAHREMCAGRMTLSEVQAIFLGDFWIEYDKIAAIKGWPKRSSAK